jgi:hypothetical protein
MNWDKPDQQTTRTERVVGITIIRSVRQTPWMWQWHPFIDHLAEGKKTGRLLSNP